MENVSLHSHTSSDFLGQAAAEQRTGASMLDEIKRRLQLKNDAQLARTVKVQPPVISKVRTGATSLGADLLIKLHEATGMGTMEIKKLAGILVEDANSAASTVGDSKD